MSYQILNINESLHSTLKDLQAFLGVIFDQDEVQQVFLDAAGDKTSYKTYTFYKAPSYSISSLLFSQWTITGAVEEYEPEMLFLKSTGGIGKRKKFNSFFVNRQGTRLSNL